MWPLILYEVDGSCLIKALKRKHRDQVAGEASAISIRIEISLEVRSR